MNKSWKQEFAWQKIFAELLKNYKFCFISYTLIGNKMEREDFLFAADISVSPAVSLVQGIWNMDGRKFLSNLANWNQGNSTNHKQP